MAPVPAARQPVTVLLGDPSLPDPTKREGAFHAEDFDARERMQAALASLERYELAYWDRHADLLQRLEAQPPAFVLNFCDTGFRNDAFLEWHIPAVLEMLGIPYSGAPPAAMAICYDKGLVRGLAADRGVPVPTETYCATPAEALAALTAYPALLKPNHGDGSVGITRDALVRDRAAAEAYVAWLAEALPGRAVLVQEYLPGPEYSVGVLGNPGADLRVLPVLEVDFTALPAGFAPILSFESKAVPDSPYWTDIRFREARLVMAARAAMEQAARDLFARLGLRDYARFDFRTDAAGVVKLMEVNPNPAWGFDGKLAIMVGLAGMDYADLLGAIVETALARVARERGLPHRPPRVW